MTTDSRTEHTILEDGEVGALIDALQLAVAPHAAETVADAIR